MQRNVSLALVLCSLLFWSWLNQFLWLGMGLIAVILSIVLSGRKLNIERDSFHHISDLCLLLVIGVFAYYWIDTKASKAIFPTLRLLPVTLLPLLISQYLHEKNSVPFSALLMLKRKFALQTRVNIEPLFLAVCLFSAGAAEQASDYYFFGVSAIIFAFVFLQPSTISGKVKLLFIFAVIVGLAYLTQVMQLRVQHKLEESFNQWLLNKYSSSHISTAIGQVGRLKLSDEILFRVSSAHAIATPLLLQTNSYQRYAQGQWYSVFTTIRGISNNKHSWLLAEQESETESKQLRIYQAFKSDKATLPLPLNVTLLENLDVEELQIEKGGSVVAKGLPPFTAYDVLYGSDSRIIESSKAADLHIPKDEQAVITNLVKQLKLDVIKQEQGDAAVLRALKDYFFQNYTYSTWLQGGKPQTSALANFLLHSRSGHCEFFATATVLLLRQLNIPARYMVGYSMQERGADSYRIRGRDAHAWAIAELNGVWLAVDNTPPGWFEFEDENRGYFSALKDEISELIFAFRKWRYLDEQDLTAVWLMIMFVLLAFLMLRVIRRVKVEHKENGEVVTTYAQIESDWLELERLLRSSGYERFQGETLMSWAKRIKREELLPLIRLYYKQRFHAEGLTASEEEMLRRQSQSLQALLKQQA